MRRMRLTASRSRSRRNPRLPPRAIVSDPWPLIPPAVNWSNVKLIWLREVRDQLRDRRTLFLIAVLPLLLYPLLGMSFIQVSQFLGEHPTRVLVVGLPDLPGLPPLIEKVPDEKPPEPKTDAAPNAELKKPVDQYRFAIDRPPDKAEKTAPRLLLVDVKSIDELGVNNPNVPIEQRAKDEMQTGDYDVVVCFPSDFAQRMVAFRNALAHHRQHPTDAAAPPEVPSLQIYYNSAKEKSQVAFARVSDVLGRWQEAIGQQNLKESDLPAAAIRPFAFPDTNVAEPSQQRAALWAKILPFVLLIWALTGAFYPAVDLCAGEKERGTLETLLSSPADRSEIVAGKLLTVMGFSMATSLLNLASLGLTGLFVMHQVGNLQIGMPSGPPPWSALPWLVVALVPVSALFSALCLALAVLARSSKEGQYYLMPLVLVTIPLLILPMSPGVELTLGNSLIPLSGLLLLLRMLLEGNGWEALRFVPAVALSTGICCYLAIRWAIDQFNSETVLFRESERLDLRLWLKHLIRDRGDTPTIGAAMACGLLILITQFFVGLLVARPGTIDFAGATWLIIVSMLAVVVPTALMTGLFSRKPAKTLLVRRPPWLAIPAALLLAVAVHPLAIAFQWVVQSLFPLGRTGEALGDVAKALESAPVWWLPFALLGLLPAVCEEFTFRGFILSGLRHTGHKWRAILVSALFFALSHQIFQQSVSAFIMGTLLAYVAVQSGSIWPSLVIHAVHNGLAWVHGEHEADVARLLKDYPGVGWSAILVGALLTMWLLSWFSRLKYSRTDEERVEEAIAHEAAEAIHV